MAGKVTVKMDLNGLVPMVRRLDAFEKKIRKKTLTKCGNEASKAVLKVLKARCPTEPKGFRKSLARKVVVYESQRLFWIVGAKINYWLAIKKDAKWFTDAKKRRRRIPVTSQTPEQYATVKRLATRLIKRIEKKTGFVSQTVNASKQIVLDAYERVLSEAVREA